MVTSMGREEVTREPLTQSSGSRGVFRDRTTSVPDEASLGSPHSHDYYHQQQQHQMMSVPSSGLVTDHIVQRRGRGKSWKDILRLRRKRAKLAAPPLNIEKSEEDSDVYKPKPSGYCIRVVVSEINPQAYYKTLEINHHTTAFEVIVKLIKKYALKDEDRDPNEFYLTEVSMCLWSKYVSLKQVCVSEG